ncbi:guanylate-binding protein 1-like isoform X2 [Mya arenaria]|uniref:guanylate-binding protein 1-like isoform X2 n=1 Tax=Mya arenaria TaxID=6604 RepID=UPI0022E492FB|nr:guanylate-binding protein 1-like isoform X2 [Mya arenaria]
MASKENPVDSSAVSGCRAKLQESSLGEQIQKNTDSARKATSLKNTGRSKRFVESTTSLVGYLSMHDSTVFQEPQCLIRTNAEDKLEICDNVLAEISCIDKPCVIVAVAGPYKTGKSYLMNLLAGKRGFALGDTVQLMTKGIWVRCVAHPVQNDTVVILLDTEGLGDPEKEDSTHDHRIFTLATLLCSTLVYNMKGAFDQEAVNKLTFVSQMSQNIRFGERCDEKNTLLQCVLPGFVLALRDFSLKLIKDGRKVKPDEYLEEFLESKRGKGGNLNKQLDCIRDFFPQDKRKCFLFPVPGDGEILENLDSLEFQDLSQKFNDVVTMFVSYIYSQEPKQLQVSKSVNGSMFAQLTRQYVEDLAKSDVPDVDKAFLAVAKLENERVKKECLSMFQLRMDRILLPIPATILHAHYLKARRSALIYMGENAVEDVANVVEIYTEKELDLIWQKMQCKNNKEIEEHCSTELSSLKSLSGLKTGLQNQTYEVPRGYRKFRRDVDMIRQEYEQVLREYAQGEITMIWNDFENGLGMETIQILKNDPALSEEEKQREKKEALDKQQNELNAERQKRERDQKKQIKTMQLKVASLEKNQEERNRILDQINDLNEKKRIHWEEENQLLKNEVKHFAERIAELEKKEEERKANGFHASILDAIFNN